jgi:glycosyltransferase involved in cell wall biosynthesis
MENKLKKNNDNSNVKFNNLKKDNIKTFSSVAVIIPFFNGSDYIERAIRSVVEQSIQPTEFIIVNDGSSDKESEYILRLNKKYKFTLINKKNGGQGSARNTGVLNSKAKYICFLDQDDYYLYDHIEKLCENIDYEDPRFGFVSADLWLAEGDGRIITQGLLKEMSIQRHYTVEGFLSNDVFILPSATIIARKAFDAVGGFDERLTGYEDDDLFFRMFVNGFVHKYISDCVYVWCQHVNSCSYSIKMSRSRLIYFNKLCDTFPDQDIRNIFYFRDLILPRFQDKFLRDALKYKLRKHQGYNEVMDIAQDCYKRIKNNKSVFLHTRFRFFGILIIIRYMPLVILEFFKLLYNMVLSK